MLQKEIAQKTNLKLQFQKDQINKDLKTAYALGLKYQKILKKFHHKKQPNENVTGSTINKSYLSIHQYTDQSKLT